MSKNVKQNKSPKKETQKKEEPSAKAPENTLKEPPVSRIVCRIFKNIAVEESEVSLLFVNHFILLCYRSRG